MMGVCSCAQMPGIYMSALRCLPLQPPSTPIVSTPQRPDRPHPSFKISTTPAMNTKHMSAVVGASLLLHALSAQPGALDETFGDGGKVFAPIGAENDLAHAAVLQPDGRIIAAGWAKMGATNDFALARFTADGAPDLTFGTAGKLTTDIGSGDDQAIAVALQPDGCIVAAGWTFNGADLDFALVRYLPDGTADSSFGIAGKQTTDLGASDYITSVAVQPDGKIVVAGHTNTLGTLDFALARYLPDGTPDGDFGTGGTVITDFFQNNDWAASVALQADGKIVVAGLAITGADYDFALTRYHPNGSLDDSFGTGGKVTTAFGPSDDKGIAVLLQPDGKILAGGYLYNGAHYDFALARYDTDGSLDEHFGNAGKTVTDFDGEGDLIAALALQPDGKIVAAGRSSNGQHYDFALARYLPSGILDNSFGAEGRVVTPVSTGQNSAFAALIQPGGNIVLAGYAYDGPAEDFALARYVSGLSVGAHDVFSPVIEASVFPNPARQNTTTLEYTLQAPASVSVRLFDIRGRVVQTFSEGRPDTAGTHQRTLSLSADLPPGVYLVVITAGNGSATLELVK
ncbi:MAG: T9SS C-terminal target domain-containing protein [Haliscomenobacteraceae bacterium CHB4]|nr:T9SS C-terminal target domain-containing protein [Haliscomenobacteraceae bacterium CHB4]